MPDEPMPPLGPPFGPAQPPPPPQFPDHPPTQWSVPPVALTPVEPSGAPSPFGGPPRRERVLVAIVASLVVLLLVTATVAWVTHDDGPERVSAPGRTTTTEPSTTEQQSSDPGSSDSSSSSDSDSSSSDNPPLDEAVIDIKAFVERERGLKFLTDVPVSLADDNEFTTELLAEFDKDVAEVQELEQVLTALGFVDASDDVVQQERDLVSAGVVGFYDPEKKQLVVRGTDTTPYVRQVLAHELTHALDDQHFNLNRPELDTADDETGFGFSSLAEGNARRIEDAYVDSMSPEDQQQAEQEATLLVAQSPQIFQLPPVLLNLIQVPYDVGRHFVDRLVTEGGNAKVDAAYAAPPSTSEQVYEPDDYLSNEGAVPVPDPSPDEGAIPANRGVLGVVMLQQMLDPLGFGGTTLDPALERWGGDKYVTWTHGTSTCIKDVIVGDDRQGTVALYDALNDWAAGPGVSATITRDASDPAAPFALVACA